MQTRHDDESAHHAMPPAVCGDNTTRMLWPTEFTTPSSLDDAFTSPYDQLATLCTRLNGGDDGGPVAEAPHQHIGSSSPGVAFTPWALATEGGDVYSQPLSNDWADWTPPPDQQQQSTIFQQQEQSWLDWDEGDSHTASSATDPMNLSAATEQPFEQRTGSQPTLPVSSSALPLHTPSVVAASVRSSLPQPHSSLQHLTSLSGHHAYQPANLPHQQLRPALPAHFSLGVDRVVAKKACIPCRNQKVSCGNERPCNRCTKFGRECIDRTLEEVVAARRRVQPPGVVGGIAAPATSSRGTTNHSLKRPSPYSDVLAVPGAVPSPLPASSAAAAATAATIDPTTIDPASYANSVEETDKVSILLWSRSFLAVLVKLQLRDTILGLHAVIDSLPMDLPNLLEWHSQCAMMCLDLSDALSVEDWTTFLTDGLTEQQLNSPVWLSSPLAPWAKLSTRPLYFVVKPLPAHLEHVSHCSKSNLSSGESPKPEHAQMIFNLLPAAHRGFQNWSRMLATRILFERQVRANRTPIPPAAAIVPPTTPATDHDDEYARGDGDDKELDDLTHKFSLLDWSQAFSSDPTPEDEHNTVDTVLHARWCPRAALELEACADPANSSAITSKMTRTTNRSARDAADCDDPTPCLCTLATPLPYSAHINPTMEAQFSWRRVEIEAGMRKEGIAWLRRLYPPSAWPADQLDQGSNWKSQIKYAGELAIAACRATMATSAADSSPLTVTPPNEWAPKRERVWTKHGGERDTNVYRRTMRVTRGDGAQFPSRFTITWHSTPLANETTQAPPSENKPPFNEKQ